MLYIGLVSGESEIIQAVPSVFIEDVIRSADIHPAPSRQIIPAIANIFCISFASKKVSDAPSVRR